MYPVVLADVRNSTNDKDDDNDDDNNNNNNNNALRYHCDLTGSL